MDATGRDIGVRIQNRLIDTAAHTQSPFSPTAVRHQSRRKDFDVMMRVQKCPDENKHFSGHGVGAGIPQRVQGLDGEYDEKTRRREPVAGDCDMLIHPPDPPRERRPR
jgi:hypothetical protein